MKSIQKKDLNKIRQALAMAYHERKQARVGGMWEVRVMGHIQSLVPPSIKIGYFELFQQFLWRLAPVVSLLVIILIVTIAKIDFFSDYEIAKIFISEPKDFILLAMNN